MSRFENSPSSKSSSQNPRINMIHSYLRPKLHLATQSFTKTLNRSGQISLTSKVRKEAKLLLQSKQLLINISDENILKTPSSTNENPPNTLELLNESLNQYYENEIPKMSFQLKSNTPVPSFSGSIRKSSERVRSGTPMLRYNQEETHLPYMNNKAAANKMKVHIGKKLAKNINKIRYFSRRERKSKSPESKKFMYYYFN